MSKKKLFATAKKDARNGKESGHWKPAKWNDSHVRRFLRHTVRHAWDQAILFLGPRYGQNAIIEFLSGAEDRESAVMLARLGVKTIGDVERCA